MDDRENAERRHAEVTTLLDVRRLLQNMADIEMTACAIEAGVRVKLSGSIQYQDLPQGAVTAISLKECGRLEKDLLVERVEEPGHYAPTVFNSMKTRDAR